MAVLLVAVALATVVGYLRLSPAAAATVWAEDGGRFLAGQLAEGPAPSLLEPYAGYMHLMPRTGAALAATLPLEWAATVLALVASAVVAGCAWATYELSAGHLPARAVRLPLAAAVVLLPMGGYEALGNVANSHWFLMAGAFWALAARTTTTGRTALAVAVVTFAMASDPLTLVLAPLVLARLVVLRAAREQAPTLAFVVAGAVQMAVVSSTDRVGAVLPPLGDVLHAYVARVALVLAVGPDRAQDVLLQHSWPAFVVLGVLTAGVFAVVAVLGDGRLRMIALAAGLASVALYAIPASISWTPTLEVTAGPDVDLVSLGRYTVAPSLLLLVVVAAACQAVLERPTPRPIALAVALVAIAVAVPFVTGFRAHPDVRAGGPPWREGVERATAECRAAPDLASSDVGLAPNPDRWRTSVPCSSLR